jgi:hypothetical protein
MTNRDPNTGDFVRKFNELYQCVHNYLSLKNTEKQLIEDLQKPDINLVCNYEIHELKKHLRSQPWGLDKSDFEFLDPKDTAALKHRLHDVYKA